MKIKLAIIDKNIEYVEKITSKLLYEYSDNLELYSITEVDALREVIDREKIDIVLVSNEFDINLLSIPKKCVSVYLVDKDGIEYFNEKRAICRYQKIEILYKQILNIYSDFIGNVLQKVTDNNNTRVVLFSSPSGGVGTSSVAVSYAIRLSKKGKKVLYINLEEFGTTDIFFESENKFSMTDIIYSVTSGSNLFMKLESCLNQDENGVYFFSVVKVALHMQELSNNDIVRILKECKKFKFDVIILDMNFTLDKKRISLYEYIDSWVWVSDGTEISNRKAQKAYNSVVILEQELKKLLLNKISIIYNRFSNKGAKSVGDLKVNIAGGINKVVANSAREIINYLSEQDCLDNIFKKDIGL